MRKKLTIEEFVKKAKQVHGDKYDYSKAEYKDNRTKICIICKEHGEFWQRPNDHLNGQGCPKCGNIAKKQKQLFTREEFIKRAIAVHGNYYDYSKVEYINDSTKVCIICPKHGEFWQTPNKHLYGQGCFECSKILNSNESRLFRLLQNKYSKYRVIRQYHNKEIIGNKSIDIFIDKYNIGIEYQGGQHFKPIKMFGGYNGFLKIAQRDKEKYNECKSKNIKLLYFTFDKKTIPDMYIDTVYYKFEDLCNKIDLIIKNYDL